MNYVSVKLTVDRMRHEIVAALMDHETDLRRMAEQELDKAIAAFDWEAEVQSIARDVICKSIGVALEEIVSGWAFKEMVREAMKESRKDGER
jgi:hypothetical protein